MTNKPRNTHLDKPYVVTVTCVYKKNHFNRSSVSYYPDGTVLIDDKDWGFSVLYPSDSSGYKDNCCLQRYGCEVGTHGGDDIHYSLDILTRGLMEIMLGVNRYDTTLFRAVQPLKGLILSIED